MRGARIAEKIQEYYHSNGSTSQGIATQGSRGSTIQAKPSTNNHQFKATGGGIFQITNKNNQYGRPTHTSHGGANRGNYQNV
jgi:hypothetical protein